MPIDSSPLSLHFLCVGADHSFIAHLIERSEPIDVSLDTCKTAEEARQKMRHNAYDVYVIDIHISEKPALELIQEIRKKDEKGGFIATIASSYSEEENFVVLKERGIINYMLEKPIETQQFDTFIKTIHHHFSPHVPSSMTDKLDALKHNYEKTIPEKLSHLTNLIKAAQQYPDAEHLTELRNAVHKIGGSAGSYGFTIVSSLCKDMDTQISEKLATGTVSNKTWLDTLPKFLKKVEEGFKTTAQQQLLAPPTAPHKRISTVYVVDHDTKFLESLELAKGEFPIELLVESNPQKAIDKLHNVDFNPSALVVSQTFPSATITAFDIIRAQHQKLTHQPTLFALILEQDNIDIRIEAMQRGVSYIFRKPIYANVLLKIISDTLHVNTLGHFKVLVLDDDIDFCNFVTIALSEIGVTVRTINDSADLFRSLEEFRPQVLLLDLVLPKYDGLNLLKTLRQDVAFENLIVVIVTSSEEPMTRLSAYSAKADDILYKPLDIAILQKRILNFAERHKAPADHAADSDHSSLVNLKTLMARIENSLKKPSHHLQYLALFEINNFTDWLMQHGNAAVNDLLMHINKQIAAEYGDSTRCFSYNLSRFAIIFDEEDHKVIEEKMLTLLTELSRNQPQQDIAFNCGIVPISKNFGNAHQILHVAEECLNKASKNEAAPARIIALSPKDIPPTKKEVVLIDSDEELLKILEAAFEAHGVAVHTHVEGESALKALLASDVERLPALLIVERKLADMDGLDLMIKVNEHFNKTVPFYILSLFSSDKDISEGLRQGALEYISKPFNLSILMQKALKTIFG